MFCSKCGSQIPDNQKYCTKCGYNFGGYIPAYQTQSSKNFTGRLDGFVDQASKVLGNFTMNGSTNNANDDFCVYKNYTPSNPNGVERIFKGHWWERLGGFLMFIVVCCYIGGSLEILNAILQLVSFCMTVYQGIPIAGILSLIGCVVSILVSIFLFIMGNKIRHRDVTFLRFYQVVSILSIVLGVVLVVIEMCFGGYSGFFLWHYNWAYLVGTIIGTVLFGGLAIFLYTLYFAKSERVVTYFGTDIYLKLSPFTKNVVPPLPAWSPNSKNFSTAVNNSYPGNGFYQNSSNGQQNYGTPQGCCSQQQNFNGGQTFQQNAQGRAQANTANNQQANGLTCPGCGNALVPGAPFCQNCGRRVS